MVTDDEGATETYTVVFTLDADFYVVGSGDDVDEILRLKASVHVDHPDPLESILTGIYQGTCFELPEDVFCTGFDWTAYSTYIMLYESKVADAYLGRPVPGGDEFEIEYVGDIAWICCLQNSGKQRGNVEKVYKSENSVVESDETTWTRS